MLVRGTKCVSSSSMKWFLLEYGLSLHLRKTKSHKPKDLCALGEGLTWNSLLVLLAEVYSEPCQTSMMALFAKIVNDFQPLSSLLTWTTFSVLFLLTESYSEPFQISKVELFMKIGLTVFYSNYPLAV